jgi:hypothetical protein
LVPLDASPRAVSVEQAARREALRHHGALRGGRPVSTAEAMQTLFAGGKRRTTRLPNGRTVTTLYAPSQGRSREARHPTNRRARGSRRSAARSSSRGGDSGDSDSDEPPGGRKPDLSKRGTAP